jgi:hypothetical protein
VESLTTVAKAISDFGGMATLGVAMMLLYRLTDKWGGAFLTAQQEQTRAMAQQASAVAGLVDTVKEGQRDQRDVLMAVHTLNDRIERQVVFLQQIEELVRAVGAKERTS